MCLDPGLKLLSMSRLRELSTTEDNVSLYFLKKEDEDFPGGWQGNIYQRSERRTAGNMYQGDRQHVPESLVADRHVPERQVAGQHVPE
jgi:hypothetical protein